MEDLRPSRHCVSTLNVHSVFVTKYRRGVLDAPALEWLGTHFAKVCEKMEARLLAFDGRDDHVHLLVEYPPRRNPTAELSITRICRSQGGGGGSGGAHGTERG